MADNTINDEVTQVVNIKIKYLKPEYQNLIEWLKEDNHVYIGRDMSFYVDGAFGSKWKNPFKVAKAGREYKNKKNYYTLDESLSLYKKHILDSPELMASLPELKGKVLGCWCKPNRCHGDVLLELIESYT